MKKLAILFAFILAPVAFAAADAPVAPDYPSIVALVRQQRDQACQSAQDANVQIALLQKQVGELQAKNAELQKQIDDAKAKAKPAVVPAKK